MEYSHLSPRNEHPMNAYVTAFYCRIPWVRRRVSPIRVHLELLDCPSRVPFKQMVCPASYKIIFKAEKVKVGILRKYGFDLVLE